MKHSFKKNNVEIIQRLIFEDAGEERYGKIKLYIYIKNGVDYISSVVPTRTLLAILVTAIRDNNDKMMRHLLSKKCIEITMEDFKIGKIGEQDSLSTFESFLKRFKEVPIWEQIKESQLYNFLSH